MDSFIRKWGNSPALRLGTGPMRMAGLELDQRVSIRAVPGRIVVEPVNEPDLRLEDLVAGITDENRHDEVPVGQSVGKEYP